MKLKKILLMVTLIIFLGGCSFKNLFVRENIEPDYYSGKHYVEMSVKDYGIIQLELDADVAPITVTNFLNLVDKGFYNGLTFHRIMKGFMMQGGDPEGIGTGGSGTTIKGEFLANGVDNSILHERGTISMARSSNDYDSASSQFFIMQEARTSLDNYYAAFGHVISGMDVVDKICNAAEPTDDNGSIAKINQPIIMYIKVVDSNE